MKTISTILLVVLASSHWCFGTTHANALTLHGRVFNSRTHLALGDAEVSAYCNNDFSVDKSEHIKSGEFSLAFEKYGWYIISISAPGYMAYEDTLWVMNDRVNTINKSFYLAPIEIGITSVLKNIYFESGKKELSEQSFPELDKMAIFFQENSSVQFEIIGHTDNVGPENVNQFLSTARAQAVVEYLIHHGIQSRQLNARGAGESQPIETNETAEGRAKNRRVEVKVVSMASDKKDN